MKTVFKYPFRVEDSVALVMPEGAEIIHVAVQGYSVGVLMAWAIIDTDRPAVPRTLFVRGTGHPFTGDEGRHLATVIEMGGSLVWHVFEARS